MFSLLYTSNKCIATSKWLPTILTSKSTSRNLLSEVPAQTSGRGQRGFVRPKSADFRNSGRSQGEAKRDRFACGGKR